MNQIKNKGKEAWSEIKKGFSMNYKVLRPTNNCAEINRVAGSRIGPRDVVEEEEEIRVPEKLVNLSCTEEELEALVEYLVSYNFSQLVA